MCPICFQAYYILLKSFDERQCFKQFYIFYTVDWKDFLFKVNVSVLISFVK